MSLVFVFSCSQTESEAKSTKENVEEELTTAPSKVDIDYVKSVSKKGMTSFDMDELYNQVSKIEPFQNENLINLLSSTQIDTFSDYKIVPGYYGLKPYQWDEIDGDFLFTFFNETEECCLFKYCCVTDNTGEILSLNSFGVIGGDGGWSVREHAELMYPGTYHYYSTESEVDFSDEMEVTYTTKKEYILRFKNHTFSQSELKSISLMDTLYIEYGC